MRKIPGRNFLKENCDESISVIVFCGVAAGTNMQFRFSQEDRFQRLEVFIFDRNRLFPRHDDFIVLYGL